MLIPVICYKKNDARCVCFGADTLYCGIRIENFEELSVKCHAIREGKCTYPFVVEELKYWNGRDGSSREFTKEEFGSLSTMEW